MSKLTKDIDTKLTQIQAMIHDPLTTLLYDFDNVGVELTSEQFQITLGSAIRQCFSPSISPEEEKDSQGC